MDDSLVDNFKFDWSGLHSSIYDLGLTNHVGHSKKFIYVKLPEFVPTYGNNDNRLLFPERYVEPHSYGGPLRTLKNVIGLSGILFGFPKP